MNAKHETLAWLQENGFRSDEPVNNQANRHPLILAAQQGRADILSHLLASGTDLNVVDEFGNNALWAACFAEASDCIALLLEAGINIDYQSPSGANALIYSASSGKHSVVAQLLQAGANPLLTTQDDFSALDLAATRQCLQLLRKAMALTKQLNDERSQLNNLL